MEETRQHHDILVGINSENCTAAISFAHVTLTVSGEPLPVIDGLTRELSNAVYSGATSLRRAREVSPLTATVDDRKVI